MKRKDKILVAHDACVGEVRTAYGENIAKFTSRLLPFMVLMLTVHVHLKDPTSDDSVGMIEHAIQQYIDALVKAIGLTDEEIAVLFEGGLLDTLQERARTMYRLTDDKEDKEEAHG